MIFQPGDYSRGSLFRERLISRIVSLIIGVTGNQPA
jgi:hypothetical protein